MVSKQCIVDTGILIVTVVYYYTSGSSIASHLHIKAPQSVLWGGGLHMETVLEQIK